MDPLLAYLVAGKDPSHVNFQQDFGEDLLSFLSAGRDAGHDISIYSGYRSPAHQKRLWDRALKKYGSAKAARKWVAPPGRSQHNMGTASDLRYGSDAARQWAHANAGDYGLNFRMSHEPWHIEPVGGAPAKPHPLLGAAQAMGFAPKPNERPNAFRELMSMQPRERGPAIRRMMTNGLMMGSTPLDIDASSPVLPSVQGEQALLARGQPFDKAAVYGSMLAGTQPHPSTSSQPLPRPRSTGLAMQGPRQRPQPSGPRPRPMMMDAHIPQRGGLGRAAMPNMRPGLGGFLAGLLGL